MQQPQKVNYFCCFAFFLQLLLYLLFLFSSVRSISFSWILYVQHLHSSINSIETHLQHNISITLEMLSALRLSLHYASQYELIYEILYRSLYACICWNCDHHFENFHISTIPCSWLFFVIIIIIIIILFGKWFGRLQPKSGHAKRCCCCYFYLFDSHLLYEKDHT